jgi:hypothetical protein
MNTEGYRGAPDIRVPESGPCFICHKLCGPGSWCVPCKGFVCWTHASPDVGQKSNILDHDRCGHV